MIIPYDPLLFFPQDIRKLTPLEKGMYLDFTHNGAAVDFSIVKSLSDLPFVKVSGFIKPDYIENIFEVNDNIISFGMMIPRFTKSYLDLYESCLLTFLERKNDAEKHLVAQRYSYKDGGVPKNAHFSDYVFRSDTSVRSFSLTVGTNITLIKIPFANKFWNFKSDNYHHILRSHFIVD